MNMTPKNRAYFESEKEVIHLILTGIGDEICSTVNACQTAQEIWEVIERLQQSESLNIQDVKTNLFWEFGQFTSHDGETIESYYIRFYKMMNEMIRNNMIVATMQNKAKEIAKPITPPSESAFEEDSDPEQAQRDKDMQKNLALIEKYFKKIYKPTNNNLRTSSNTRNKNMDTTPRKPKWVKDFTYLQEKMLLCKQAEKVYMDSPGRLYANSDTDAEPLETGTNMITVDMCLPYAIANFFEQSESISNACAVETGDSNVLPDSPDMYDNDIQDDQNDVECDDERVALANLIANLKLDVDENKKI
ncbi:hypothetical protein Tco_0031012 [Tanacetum coccineum]